MESCCSEFTSGSGIDLSIGFFYKFQASDEFSVLLKTSFEGLKGDLSSSETIPVLLDNLSQPATVEQIISAKITTFNIGSLISHELFNRFHLFAGINAGFLINKNFESFERIVQPEDRGFFPETMNRRRNKQSGGIGGLNSLAFNIELGFGYDFYLNRQQTYFITPELHYSLGLNSLLKENTWKVNTLKIGFKFSYSPQIGLSTPLKPIH